MSKLDLLVKAFQDSLAPIMDDIASLDTRVYRLERATKEQPADLPTPEQVAQSIMGQLFLGATAGGYTTNANAHEIIADAIRADRARRVVGIDPERVRAILRLPGGPADTMLSAFEDLLAEHDARAGGDL